MRIAFVSEAFLPSVGGVVTRLQRTLEQLQAAGDEVLLVAPAGGPSSYAGAQVVGLNGLEPPLYARADGHAQKRAWRAELELANALHRFAPELIHVVSPALLGLGAVHQARRLGVPLIASYHANLPIYQRYHGRHFPAWSGWRELRMLHERVDIGLCVSLATLQMLQAHRFERLKLWPNAVDSELFHPRRRAAAWRARLSSGRGADVIALFVGCLAREKELERLLPLAREHNGVSLAVVGDGPQRKELEGRFAGTSTTFLGPLKDSDLAGAFASADLSVFTCDAGTLGLVMLEAQASGLPVVALDGDPAGQLVRRDSTGLRCNGREPGALSRSVRMLAQDRSSREAMGKQARAAAEAASWESATQRLRAIYGEACQSDRSARSVSPKGQDV